MERLVNIENEVFHVFYYVLVLFCRFFDSWYKIKYLLAVSLENSMLCGPETLAMYSEAKPRETVNKF